MCEPSSSVDRRHDGNKCFGNWLSNFDKKISSITLITKTKLWKYGNVFACNIAFVQLSSRITRNLEERWKRHLNKSSYSLQMKLKTGLSLKNTNFFQKMYFALDRNTFAELKHLNDGHTTRVDVKKTDPKKTTVFFKSPHKKSSKTHQKKLFTFALKNLLWSKKSNKQDTCTVKCTFLQIKQNKQQ